MREILTYGSVRGLAGKPAGSTRTMSSDVIWMVRWATLVCRRAFRSARFDFRYRRCATTQRCLRGLAANATHFGTAVPRL